MKHLAAILALALLLPLPALSGTCHGKTPCKACVNCKACRHCNPPRSPKDPRPKPTCQKCHVPPIAPIA